MRTQRDFQKWAEERLKALMGTLVIKGDQYTVIDASAFANFERSASQWGTDVPYQIMQAAQKHWTFLVGASQENLLKPESWGFALHNAPTDLIVYMLLLSYFMEGDTDAIDLPSGSD